jgi:NAD(P)-dependent dehydrogenase (short-subunit alcohol dehydrogenase family)
MARGSRTSERALLTGAALGLGIVAREALSRLTEANLTGQVALVTGGSRGLGLLIARELARQGCAVAICARDQQELDFATQYLVQNGANVFSQPCDVTDREAVQRLVEAVTGQYGRIDILVNNAGVIQVGPARVMELEDYQQALNVMYWGVVYPTLAVLPQMLDRRDGRIVNITSIGGKVSVPHLLPYSSAKFAAVGFSEGLAAELKRDGVKVTTVVPGLMRTGSHLHALFKSQQELEFGMFSLLATLPLVSIDAERAARQIVMALRRAESERILTVPANIAACLHGLFPGATVNLLGLVNRLLPGPDRHGLESKSGGEIKAELNSPLFNTLTGWGESAARRFNQLGGRSRAAASHR